jgi:hypothetical protein
MELVVALVIGVLSGAASQGDDTTAAVGAVAGTAVVAQATTWSTAAVSGAAGPVVLGAMIVADHVNNQ